MSGFWPPRQHLIDFQKHRVPVSDCHVRFLIATSVSVPCHVSFCSLPETNKVPRQFHVIATSSPRQNGSDVIASVSNPAHILNRFVNFFIRTLNTYISVNFRSLKLRLDLLDSLDRPLCYRVFLLLIKQIFGCQFLCRSFLSFSNWSCTQETLLDSLGCYSIQTWCIGSDPLLFIKKCTVYHTSNCLVFL